VNFRNGEEVFRGTLTHRSRKKLIAPRCALRRFSAPAALRNPRQACVSADLARNPSATADLKLTIAKGFSCAAACCISRENGVKSVTI
jgi:hypothetical protein